MGEDDRRVYDMVARRFLAVFHPEAVFENTRVETTVESTCSARAARCCSCPGWRGVYGEVAEGESTRARRTRAASSSCRKLEQGEDVDTREVAAAEKETKPPRRYTDASLLGAMETAGKLVDDDELREAMKDSGIGTPATRAAIIERLIDVGYIERDGRALVVHREGRERHPPARRAPADLAGADRRLGAPPRQDRGTASDSRKKFMARHREVRRARRSRELDDKLKDVRIPRANLGPCPVCGHDIIENRKGYSCWSREDPGCGFVIWKAKAGKTLPPPVVARADPHRPHRASR